MDGLVIEVGDLLGVPGSHTDVSVTGPIEGLRGALGWVDEDDPVEVVVTVESLADGLAVTGAATGNLHLVCSRCLTEFNMTFEQRIDEAYYLEKAEERGGYEVAGAMLDLEPMLRDVIVLGIPVRPLHSLDCKGLCPECGTDRNTQDCGHSSRAGDIRWAPLADLAAELKEGREQ